jgi:type IV secretory pathway component VirB8
MDEFERTPGRMLEREFFKHDAAHKLQEIEQEYYKQAAAYYKAQSDLLAEQSGYAKTIKCATWIIAIATVIYAIIATLQWLFPVR